MEIEFNPNKNIANIEKHGISMVDAENLEWELLLAEEDTRYEYDEIRMIGYVPIGCRVFCVVYTDRGNVRRIISFRKANKREVKKYASQI